MAIIKGWSFSKADGFKGSADSDKTSVRAHDRSVNCYAKGGHVKAEAKSTLPSGKPQKHFDRMENFRKERDSEPASPAAETSDMKKGGKWIAGATKNKGALHRALGVSEGKKIPAKKMAMGAKSKSPKVRKEVVLAKTLKRLHKAEGGAVSKNLAPDSKLGIMGGTGTKNLVAMKKGGKAKHASSKGGGATAAKAAGALAQIAAAATQQSPMAGGMGAPPAAPPMPPGAAGPMGMKSGGRTKKK